MTSCCIDKCNGLSPCDVGNDDAVSPEVHVGGLAVVGEVLDVDRLLVQDKDVPGHSVRGPGEGAEIQRVILILAPAQASQGRQHSEQSASLKM